MGIAIRGLLECKRQNVEGFPTASDDIVFIPHELTKTGMGLLKQYYNLIFPEVHKNLAFLSSKPHDKWSAMLLNIGQ